jgi:protein O-GlcNAc transferase
MSDAIEQLNQAIGELRAGREAVARRLAIGIEADKADNVVLAPLTELLRQLGETVAAESVGRLAVARAPSAAAWNNLGVALQGDWRQDEAKAAFEQALRLAPDYPRAVYNLARLLIREANFDAAEARLRRLLAQHPNYHKARVALALIYRHRDQDAQAAACLRQVLAQDPQHRDARLQWASLQMQHAASRPAAEALLRQVLAERSRDARAWRILGKLLERQRRLSEALSAYEAGLDIEPGQTDLLADRQNVERELCAWTDWPRPAARLRHASRQALAAGRSAAISPITSCRLPVPPTLQRAIAERHAQGVLAATAGLARPSLATPPSAPPLRVGWLSHEFQYNVVGRLLAALLPAFERRRVKVIGLAYNPDTGDRFRQRIVSACDEFIDVSGLSSAEAAARLAAAKLHILVDITPYLENGKPGIAALRPAPIQVSYLSPITSGAPWIDYFMTDPVASPAGAERHFSEQLVYLPPSYLPSPGAEPIAPMPPRAQLGLPEGARVLASFNRQDKILPATFNRWLDLLRRYPDCVLWLSADPPQARANLRAWASARGVAETRLIFADHEPDMGRHLARLQHAELFLDTFPHTAHVTAIDTLWAGAPILTRAGATFASRVAASLLTALELPELITYSAQHYEQQARALLDHPATLAALRRRLAQRRETADLFRPQALAAHLTAAFERMWAQHAAGLAPTPIDLSQPLTPE